MALTRPGLPQAERQPADEALRQIGTNGLPWVLKWMQYEEPAWRIGVFRVIGRLPNSFKSSRLVVWIVASEARQRAWLAAQTIERLGPAAGAAAIPQLSRIVNDGESQESCYRAAIALAALGKDSIPSMLAALSNPTNSQRWLVAAMIPQIRDLGTNGGPAVPVLLGCVRQEDVRLETAAIGALGVLQLQPDAVVPVLISELTNRNRDIRSALSRALASFGEGARAAVPALKESLNDPDADARGAAAVALKEIAPEELEKDRKGRRQ